MTQGGLWRRIGRNSLGICMLHLLCRMTFRNLSPNFSEFVTPCLVAENFKNEKAAQRTSFGAGYPADINADIPVDVRGKNFGQTLEISNPVTAPESESEVRMIRLTMTFGSPEVAWRKVYLRKKSAWAVLIFSALVLKWACRALPESPWFLLWCLGHLEVCSHLEFWPCLVPSEVFERWLCQRSPCSLTGYLWTWHLSQWRFLRLLQLIREEWTRDSLWLRDTQWPLLTT